MLSPQQLVAWVEDNTETMRLRTLRDVLPGGVYGRHDPGIGRLAGE